MNVQNVAGGVVLPVLAGLMAAAVAFDARVAVAVGVVLLLDVAFTIAVAAGRRATRPEWAIPFIVVQFDLFAVFLTVVAFVAGGRAVGVGLGLAALLVVAGVVGHVWRRGVFGAVVQPSSWLARAIAAVPPLGFAGGLVGYAVGRGLGAFPVVVAVLMATIAFVMVVVGHATVHRLERAG
ncbi:MAG TPA: hypothetical protein VOB72_20420 [Candidatus Dormibacteraeota bacterium]|nr:hypothetical protein [Candidatus Dormibacteraeota bacterium]